VEALLQVQLRLLMCHPEHTMYDCSPFWQTSQSLRYLFWTQKLLSQYLVAYTILLLLQRVYDVISKHLLRCNRPGQPRRGRSCSCARL